MSNDQLVSQEPENSRAMMMVQSQVLMAKKFPRDIVRSTENIINLCKNPKMANIAVYSYSRGQTTIERPSIQLAKAMALAWGNLDYSWYEIERRKGSGIGPGESDIVVYCWDLETNTRASRTFVVRHWRDTQQGGYAIKDERDIYEICANMASRRMRECILDVIPKDIETEAVKQVKETMNKAVGSDSRSSLPDRIQNLIQKFSEVGVTKAMVEKRLGKNCESMIMPDVLKYQGLCMTLIDGEQSLESVFPSENENSGGEAKEKRPLPKKTETGPKEGGSEKNEQKGTETAGVNWAEIESHMPNGEDELRQVYELVCRTYPDKQPEISRFVDKEPIEGRPVEFYPDFISGLKKIVS